ncbi:hypothetical protein ACLB2K_011258 [Fragaria x ananassa]
MDPVSGKKPICNGGCAVDSLPRMRRRFVKESQRFDRLWIGLGSISQQVGGRLSVAMFPGGVRAVSMGLRSDCGDLFCFGSCGFTLWIWLSCDGDVVCWQVGDIGKMIGLPEFSWCDRLAVGGWSASPWLAVRWRDTRSSLHCIFRHASWT